MSDRREPSGRIDSDYSDPTAAPLPWSDAVALLADAGVSWLTTVRSDGRPHVTPLLTVWDDDAVHLCTGPGEQKAHNLAANTAVALTTGTGELRSGVDVVVEGVAERVGDGDRLTALALAWERKYGSDWHFDVVDGAFANGEGGRADVHRIRATKVLAFAKDPYGQTTFTWPAADDDAVGG